MARLSEQVLNQIQLEAEKIAFGKITINFNATVGNVEIITENRIRIPSEDPTPRAGRVLHVTARREG